jgi:hypothetical protein
MPPPNDGDVLRMLGLLDVVDFRLHRLGVDRAARHMDRVIEGLVIGHPLIVAHGEAAVVAADAGPDLIFLLIHQFGDPSGIGQELTGDAHRIDLVFLDRLGGHFRIHPSGADDRDRDELLDVFDILEVAVLAHIYRRVGPIPGIIGAVIAVEHVVAGILEILRGLLAFGHIAADFDVIFARASRLLESLWFSRRRNSGAKPGSLPPHSFLIALTISTGKR